MFSRVASVAERRRGFPVEGTAREGADMVKEDVKTGLRVEKFATCVVCCEWRSLLDCGLIESENVEILIAFIVYEPDRQVESPGNPSKEAERIVGKWVCEYVEVGLMIDGWFVRRIPRHLYRRDAVVFTSPPTLLEHILQV
jgi:hypothetical protein